MRILIVSRYKPSFSDGIVPFVKEQGEALRSAGCEIDYFLIKGNYLQDIRPLKAKIRAYKPDIVHAHYGLSAITAELQHLAPVVATFHNGETLNWYVNLLSSLFSLRAKHVIYVAHHIRDLLYFKASSYSIIPCGVPMEQMIITPKDEARRQLGWSPDKKYILFGGAFSNTRKNYQLLRDAIELDYENYKENNFGENNIILEDQKITKKIEESLVTNSDSIVQTPQFACVQASGLTDDSSRLIDTNAQCLSDDCSTKKTKNIFFDANILKWERVDGGEQLGDVVCIEMKGLSRADCVLRMCACDMFALPSHSEGSPQALKEAMAVNCPCLATDIADVRELFGDESGHFILRNPRKSHERWDEDENSLREMMQLINDGLTFQERTKGRERILKLELSNEQVARRIIKIYEGILKK